MPTQHTVSSFDEELSNLYDRVVRMGQLARRQVDRAADALARGDMELAARVVADDVEIDELHAQVKIGEHNLLARRQPMARDLREIVSCGRVATDLERIGDHAKNIARRCIVIGPAGLPEAGLEGVRELHRAVTPALRDVLAALETRDAALAREVWLRDKDLDIVFNALFARLLELMQRTPELVPACVHLLFVARSIERCGDHATNVAEDVVYWVTGDLVTEQRPQATVR
jgi:phosphate transport system protein